MLLWWGWGGRRAQGWEACGHRSAAGWHATLTPIAPHLLHTPRLPAAAAIDEAHTVSEWGHGEGEKRSSGF